MHSPQGTLPRLTKLADGGNSEVFAWENDRVLKLFRDGFSAGAIAAGVQDARTAHALGVPTPRADSIMEINGRTGIIFERCAGPTLYELIVTRAQPPRRLAQVLFEVQQAIHRSLAPTLPALEQRWKAKIHHARGVPETVKQQALEAMRAQPQGGSACHGDFHPVNVILTPRGPMVIDWLDAGRSHPAPDIARTLLLLEFARPGKVEAETRAAFLAAYGACWREAWGTRFALVDRWRLPAAVARLAEVADERERRAILQLIQALAGTN